MTDHPDTVAAQSTVTREPRRLAFLPAKLIYGLQSLTLDCTVRNRSERGVKVRLFAAEPLPSRLCFLDFREQVAWDAVVVWRDYPNVGLGANVAAGLG